jgi:DMSO/TMAO reductase YedYZ molybdopterin-dependent catalytic subunit
MAGGLLLVGMDFAWNSLTNPVEAEDAGNKQLGIVPFVSETEVQLGTPINSGLDGRLFTDLTKLTPDSLITDTNKFYIRTRCPDQIDYKSPWLININGLVEKPVSVTTEQLTAWTKPLGVYLMECSGNDKAARFAMLSACQWSGVPLEQILKLVKPKAAATQVMVSGFDGHSQASMTSQAGADWIFPLSQLIEAKAFLATKMNDEQLTPDHGYPVRLVVPGWYGCTCIKWVKEITFVDDQAPATSQMKEFAARTHQRGVPALAKDYRRAIIGQAAMPIRVEKWLVDGKITYKVIGVMWGGEKRSNTLAIRFNRDETYVPVDNYQQTTNDTWTLWSYNWTPQSKGIHRIRLKMLDAKIPTIRLDRGHYMRAVDITEI